MSGLAAGTTEQLIVTMFPSDEWWTARDRPPLQPHQIPPEVIDHLWLLEAGRGGGKTEACARYFTAYMRKHPGFRGRIIAPTFGDAVESCIEGPSGLLSVDPELRDGWKPSAPGGAKIIWPNGSEALVLGTNSPRDVERLRAGGNRHIDWWEEAAANPQLKRAWDQASMGLRLGENPHSIASTTPRNTRAYREIRAEATCVRHATIDDNPHLNPSWKEKQKRRYAGTRIGRQELGGELLDDVEGALWNHRHIEAGRVERAPELVRAAVAIDPAATSGPEADDTGIISGGIGVDGHVYIIADRTCHLSPDKWGQRAVATYDEIMGDYIVGEVNNGGEMVEHVIRTVSRNRVPFRSVHASRGKQVRAQPVAVLFGNDELPAYVHIVGVLPELEDQLTTWVPGEDESPDRLDALVWLVTDLLLEAEETEEVLEFYDPVQIGPQV
jgi:phage terminase large subunit-like protein